MRKSLVSVDHERTWYFHSHSICLKWPISIESPVFTGDPGLFFVTWALSWANYKPLRWVSIRFPIIWTHDSRDIFYITRLWGEREVYDGNAATPMGLTNPSSSLLHTDYIIGNFTGTQHRPLQKLLNIWCRRVPVNPNTWENHILRVYFYPKAHSIPQ